jgi:hypothetical protein
MSLESIYRAVAHAYKAASDASGGTADEKSALAVLGGLSALLESRIHLHKQASLAAPGAASGAAPAAPNPRPPAAQPPRAASTAPAPDAAMRPTPNDSGEYDLK